jgi:hypothetical protein
VWDFRRGVMERFDTRRINYAPRVDARLRLAMLALGLGGHAVPEHPHYDHVLVLGGGIRIALGRSEYAGRLVHNGLSVGSVIGLGSLRPTNDLERAEAARLSLGFLETEADLMACGLRLAFGLQDPVETSRGEDWFFKVYGVGPRIGVLAAPSTRPGMRANTADTLLGWASLVGLPKPDERVLLVTSDPYVLFQHCDAIRLLGLTYGCGVETVCLDEDAKAKWYRSLSTTELLQEVRSSILSLRNLHTAVLAATPILP